MHLEILSRNFCYLTIQMLNNLFDFFTFRMPDEIKRLSERYPDIIQVCYLNKSNNNLDSGENDDED